MAGNVFYGTGVSDTERGNFPELKVVNMVPEGEATEPEGLVLNSRKGLKNSSITFGLDPVRALFQIDGVLNNELFAVSGNTLYGGATGAIGNINGNGPVSMAGYENVLFICAGQDIWAYTVEAGLNRLSFPDNAAVSAIATGASRLIAIRKDTGIFYWSETLTSTIGGLNFATAENSPDKLKDILFIGDTLHLFGSETVEFWPVSSSNPDLPFMPLQGRVFQKGIKATGCASKFASTFVWVADDNQICMGDPNNVISTPTIETKIAQSTGVKLWTFEMFGTEYLALRLDNHTYCFSQQYGQWIEMTSFGEPNWLPQCYENGYFGSSTTGDLYQWTNNDYSDFGGPLERAFNIWVPLDTGTTPLYNILCRIASGVGYSYTKDPTIELRASRDGGFYWGPWKQRSLKTLGQYGEKITWRSLGAFKYPGGLLEIRTTDNVPFRFSGAIVNDGY